MRNILSLTFLLCLFTPFKTDAKDHNTPKEASIFNYFSSTPAIGLYGITIGLVIGYFLPKKNSRTKQKDRRTDHTRRSDSNAIEITSLGLTLKQQEQISFTLEQKLKECETQKNILKRELDEAEKLSEIENREKEQYNAIEVGKSNTNNYSSENLTTVYYLKPSKDGTFKESSKVNKMTDALYQLTYNNEYPDEAALTFVDSPDNVFGALQNETNWLLAVCERTNLPTSQTKSIHTNTPGRAVLRNGEWQIVQKAKIEYI